MLKYKNICYKNVYVCVLITQSRLTLCDAMDHSPPGSSGHGILQAKYWSAQLFPSPGDLPNPGIEPRSPVLQVSCIYIYIYIFDLCSKTF